MNKSLYTDLIVCSKCNKKMRSIKDRKIQKYCCSTYSRSNGKLCERNTIKESFINELIQHHFNLHGEVLILKRDILLKQIKQISIDSNTIEINFYKLPSIISNNWLLTYVG